MAGSYQSNRRKPDIEIIFNDLDIFLDFCKLNLYPYNPADLYNNRSWVWRKFLNYQDRKYGRKHG